MSRDDYITNKKAYLFLKNTNQQILDDEFVLKGGTMDNFLAAIPTITRVGLPKNHPIIDDGRLPMTGPFMYYYNDNRDNGSLDDRLYLPSFQRQVFLNDTTEIDPTVNLAISSMQEIYEESRRLNDVYKSILPENYPFEFQTTYSITVFDSDVLKDQRYYNMYFQGWLFAGQDVERGGSAAPFIGIFNSDNIKFPFDVPDSDNWIPIESVGIMDQHVHKEVEVFDFMDEPLVSWSLGAWQSKFSLENKTKDAFATFIAIDAATSRIHVAFVYISPEGADQKHSNALKNRLSQIEPVINI